MRLRNQWSGAPSARLLRLQAGLLVCALMLCCAIGCGPSRPDPLAVVKDGADDDEEPRPRKPRPAAEAKPNRNAANAEEGGEQPLPSATAAPFDLTFLPVDTELVLVADCAGIIRSSLVRTLIADQYSALDPLVDGFGTRFADVESLRIGIRNLNDVPAPTKESLSAGLGGVSLLDLALNPDVSSTIVLQTRERIDESPLRKQGDEIRVSDKRYFRLKSDTFQSTCAYIHGFRTLVVADEPTIASIVESTGPPPKPKATFPFARQADLVMAMAPASRQQMQRWLSPLEKLASLDVHDDDAARSQPEDSTESAGTVVTSRVDDSDEAPAPEESGAADPEGAGSETEQPASAIARHVTGAALMVNLSEGVALSLSLECDSPEAVAEVEAELNRSAAHLQAHAVDRGDRLPGGIHELAENLSVTTLQTVAALTSRIAPDRQADIAAMPGLLLGEEDRQATGVADAAADGLEPPGAFAQQILLEGVPPTSAPPGLPGMELRGLARWQPAPAGMEKPRQMELGVVAFGGPAMNAVATGHFELQAAEVNRLLPLKWVGTATGYDELGLSPIEGFVPVDHGSAASRHPGNGVLAVYTVVPPSEPASHLRRFRGRFVMRYYTNSNEVIVENLREVIAGRELPAELKQAGVEFELSRLAGRETLEVFSPESTNIGAVQLLEADGTPLADVTSTRDSNQDQVLRTLTTGGALPEDVALSVTINSELAEVEVPFEFANLPIPNVGTLTDLQRALLVWTDAEADSGLPDGLSVEAQARWDNPDAQTDLLAKAEPRVSNKPTPTFRLTDDDDDDDRRGDRQRRRPGSGSDRPLRVLVDLTGPLMEQADALGQAHVTSIETDFRTELNFEGAWLRHQDATGEFVSLGRTLRLASSGPPGGLRVAFHFTPPLEPIHELTRFNGTVQLHISQNRTETDIADLQQRPDRKLTNRELTRLGVVLMARVEEDQILVRLLDGKDEQISELIAVDTYGDPVPGVEVTSEAPQQAGGRRVHRLRFAHGVPAGVGLRVIANSSVRQVDVPFRFTNLPVPPAPGLPGL